ncbi:hypothetical protein WICMUC_003917 [Wickerhamomyces mucosus]|uniref:ATP-dependent DNA helicase PIF1 n=1 Tax=Wickerhamomyces mucosus TaxID=1378264 RepID=A0A9P8TBX6_9ASCO|nr:hypothetical protein WICMUC_003917 [Wickerhamomyces mucosus]
MSFSKDKSTLKNPFKPLTPKSASGKGKLPQGQKTLANFFTTNASNKPLETKNDSVLNSSLERSQSFFTPPNNSAKSSLFLKKSNSSLDAFDQNDGMESDLIEIPAANNLKNSKPIGSLIPSRQTSRTSVVSATKALLLDNLRQSQSQKSSQPKKRINPWINNPINVKNPRLSQKERKEFVMPTGQSGITLSKEQEHVLELILKDRLSVFYTGSAGTGKSVLLRELVDRLKMLYGAKTVAVTASTGLAAVNIGGLTINRFSGCGIAKGSKEDAFRAASKSPENREKWRRTKVLIIDEVSMLDGAFLDKLEYVARQMMKNNKPFGGIQLVLTGDFFQLPPVPDRNGPPIKFCFESQCWNTVINKTILLQKVFRQTDLTFINLLNALRVGEINGEIESEFKKLAREVKYDDGIQPSELYPTRNEVDNSNRTRLNQLKTSQKVYHAEDHFSNERQKSLLEQTLAPKELILKEDAQVMMLKNKDETLVNGSMGKVITFLSMNVYLIIKERLRQNRSTWSELQHELRILSRCHGCDNIPEEAIEFSKKSQLGEDEFIELAKSAIHGTESLPLVQFTCKGQQRIELVERDEFLASESRSNDPTAASRRQIPLVLSWALSIHKSQGQTLDRVKVDLNKIFEAGQVYVALSRAVSKDRLQVLNFQKHKIMTNPRVKDFYKSLGSV